MHGRDDKLLEEEGLAYGDAHIETEMSRGIVADDDDTATVHADGRARDFEFENIVDIGPDPASSDEDNDNDSGTVTDDYDADSSEAEGRTKPNFDGKTFGEVTGGISELSLVDTAICVSFGYALIAF